MNEEERQRIEELSEELFRRQGLESSDATELRDVLRGSSEARREFLMRSELEAALSDAAEQGMLGPVGLKKNGSRVGRGPLPEAASRRWIGPAAASLAAVAAVLIGLGAWWLASVSPVSEGGGSSFAETGFNEDASADDVPQRELELRPESRVTTEPSNHSDLVVVADDSSEGESDRRLKRKKNKDEPGDEETMEVVNEFRSVPGLPDVTFGRVVSAVENGGEWEGGEELAIGEHRVTKGEVELYLESGVRLSVVGPAHFAIEDGMELRLLSGRLSAEVYPSAYGFRVNANEVSVVDYGTRFAVTANLKGDTAVHLYDGLVTAGTGREDGGEPLFLEPGETVRVNMASGVLEPVDFDQALFAAKPRWSGGIEWISEGVEVLEEAPRDADELSLPEGRPIVFRERSGLVLRRGTPVNLMPGEGVVSLDEDLPEVARGRRVSTYLLHGKGVGERPRIVGEIRFDSPVLGLIFDVDLLNETDRILGAPRTDYPSESSNRGPDGGSRESENAIEFGEDGRTVRFSFHAPRLDQIRILVAED